MKRMYLEPVTEIMECEELEMIAASGVKSVGGNTDLEYGGASNDDSGDARSRGIWGRWDE